MSQLKQIRAHLDKGRPLTPIQALEKFGCFRLAAQIHKLRSQGMQISTEIKYKGSKQWAVYRVVK
jgi:hypothetical protein